MQYAQDPELQALGKAVRQQEIQRLIKLGMSNEMATSMIDAFIGVAARARGREILEHGTGGSPLLRLLMAIDKE